MDPEYAKIVKRSLESYGFKVGIGQYFRSEITPNVTNTFGDPSNGIHTCNVEIAKKRKAQSKIVRKSY